GCKRGPGASLAEASATLALRTQQLLAYESGMSDVVDPLAGSWYVEALTDRIEAEARQLIEDVDALGGAAAAVEQGFFQRAIAESAWAIQQAQESGELTVVGVNRFTDDSPPPVIPAPDFGAMALDQQWRLAATKAARDAGVVAACLAEIRRTAASSESLMPPIIAAVRARASLGEVSDALRAVWGVYRAGHD
ncbi:MAG: methylmalonyl-CoA mutase family protein, partial [Gemmatimonadota bacterium]